MRVEKKLLICKIIIVACIQLAMFMIGFNFGSGMWNLTTLNEVSYDGNCSNLDLIDTVNCLNSEFDSFFYYNISNLNEQLTEEEFREIGGVCSHASIWYVEKARGLGYYAKYITFFDDTSGHAIALIYDEGINDYCIVDQQRTECFALAVTPVL